MTQLELELDYQAKKIFFKKWIHLFVLPQQVKQTEGQSEAAKQKELQRKIDEMKAEISQLDSQISGAEEHLETQGLAS